MNLNSATIRSNLSQFRLSSHQLQIEKGRHHKPKPIPADKRLCIYCKSDEVEDELHFLLFCSRYNEQRAKLFSYLKQQIPITGYTSDQIFSIVLSTHDIPQQRELGKFIQNALKIRQHPQLSQDKV